MIHTQHHFCRKAATYAVLESFSEIPVLDLDRCFKVVVEPLVYFAFLFFNETIITKTQGLVVAIAKRKYIN